jgi:sugar phosphate isomerase/epimerase
MKLGVAGLLRECTPGDVRRVRELGFSVASWHLHDLSLAADRDRLLRARETLHEGDLELCQLLPPQYPSLVHPDPAVRAAGVDALARVIRAAVVLGAGSVYVRPGSMNEAGPWTPHPDNHRPETRDRLVESLRDLVPRAAEAGVLLALEGHAVSPLDTAGVVRELLDRVGSPALRFNADPVNFIRTIDQAYDSTSLIDEMFDTLGDVVVAAHAKDVTVGEKLVVHVDECVPGLGHLDWDTFLHRFEACCPRGAVLIEHLPEEKVPAARRALLEFAARAGLAFEGE